MMTSPFSIPAHNRRIDPSRQRAAALKADGSVDDNDRTEIGPTPLAFAEWAALGLQPPHLPTMREYRLQRIREQLVARDLGGILLFDPLNIRYATDTTNMQLWTTHNPARACFVAASGHVVLWDFHGCDHLSAHLPLVSELRSGASFFYFETGDRTDAHARRFCAQVDELLRTHAGNNRRLAVDRIEVAGLRALDALGVQVHSGQEVTEFARLIKGPDEILAMRCAVASCEASVAEMRQAMRAGATENDVWAALHSGNIRRGGEWIETRILSSGPRTNPWFQESGRGCSAMATCCRSTLTLSVCMAFAWTCRAAGSAVACHPRPSRSACTASPTSISTSMPGWSSLGCASQNSPATVTACRKAAASNATA
ncbi:hypothetical protein DBADOPDK_02679 [Pseudomonas sp. MM223]|nr:hypothetical protein DBADOPDK_02679 [Pseudomonas sp. MM223]